MAEAGRWKPSVQRQGQLLPTFVEDTLAPSDPVFFIDDAVESLDLTPFEQRYAETGEHAAGPRSGVGLCRTRGVRRGRGVAVGANPQPLARARGPSLRRCPLVGAQGARTLSGDGDPTPPHRRLGSPS